MVSRSRNGGEGKGGEDPPGENPPGENPPGDEVAGRFRRVTKSLGNSRSGITLDHVRDDFCRLHYHRDAAAGVVVPPTK